jgi:hypothetical protein
MKEDRIYVDETGINKYFTRDYSRTARGKQFFGAISHLIYTRERFIAEKIESRILALFCYKGT